MDQKLQDKLNKRIEEGTLRSLSSFEGYVDFYSNDYLGYSKWKSTSDISSYGSTGSRLISGTSKEALKAESYLAEFFESDAALVFNSGYDANLGFFSSIPQRGDLVIYDEFIHASIRDGVRLSFANSKSFKHNDLYDLELKLVRFEGVKYVVVESLYSMDGDISPLMKISELCEKHKAYLIVDEAHSGGVFGEKGKGLVNLFNLQNKIFARLITFGKAFGSHGACVLTNQNVKDYLINFSRSLIYTTALPPDAYSRIVSILQNNAIETEQIKLHEVIAYFRSKVDLKKCISDEKSPIQLFKIGDILKTKEIALKIQALNLAVKPIFSPTVPIGSEGIRICLHSFNTKEEVDKLIQVLG